MSSQDSSNVFSLPAVSKQLITYRSKLRRSHREKSLPPILCTWQDAVATSRTTVRQKAVPDIVIHNDAVSAARAQYCIVP